MEGNYNTGHTTLNFILMIFASVFGYVGLTINEIDIILAIVLKIMSILSMGLIIAINWNKGIDVIKSIFKKK